MQFNITLMLHSLEWLICLTLSRRLVPHGNSSRAPGLQLQAQLVLHYQVFCFSLISFSSSWHFHQSLFPDVPFQ